ncbi:inositol monophosphatase [Kroppenstedtia pulmonis]|uniref:Inositol monophosphatase n=1 Tax=Kroppenstedtia pulmonis TaxID=1380685 RepID=A0A7D4BEM4_9BACL|nr:inositol monophosphatase [Kroppenstedtia pulmonis]QKG83692.1 inositol monophosphatase [Kroppenstedtia pulmonis]
MQKFVSEAGKLAEGIALQAGRLAKGYFRTGYTVRNKGNQGDLVTEVDEAADRLIVEQIRSSFPDHRIISEEQGTTGNIGDWCWLVDPLDGTHNYTLGFPVYGVSIALLHIDRPVLGVICDSHMEQVYMAQAGMGAVCGQEKIQVCFKKDPARMTIGWIQGYQVKGDQQARCLYQTLAGSFKRVLSLWAPSIQWCMLARGDLDGIVLYRSEAEDLYAGLLLAQEAGAAVFDFEGRSFSHVSEEAYWIACHPDQRDFFLQTVQKGLEGWRKT